MPKTMGPAVGVSALQDAANAPPQRAIGVTAQDVVEQPRKVNTTQSFYARGGLTNTALQGLAQYQKQREFKNKIKVFEDTVAKNLDGAKAAYADAISTYGEEVANWIPKPETFTDDATGLFMPFKYYESYGKGIQEFKKTKFNEQKVNEELGIRKAAEERTAGYQDQMLGFQQKSADRDEQRIGIADRQAAIGEANAITNATKASQDAANKERADKIKLRSDLRKQLSEEKKKRDDAINNRAKNRASFAGDQEKLEEFDQRLTGYRKNIRNIQRDLDELDDGDSKATNEASNIADTIEDAIDGVTEPPSWAEPFRPSAIGGGIKQKATPYNPFQDETGVVDKAKKKIYYIKAFAEGLGVTGLNDKGIETALQSFDLDQVIQKIIDVAGTGGEEQAQVTE